MAEIILPPEEENEETPQAPELNIDKPSDNSKVITIEFEAKKTNKVSTKDTNQQLYTTDTDAWFEFKETSLEGANGTYSVVFRNLHDGSIFQRTGDVVDGVAYYKIPQQEIRHAGKWRGQLVYTLENGNTTAREFGYDVKGHILDGKDVREIVVEDFETLMSQLRSMKDNAEVELASLTQELEVITETAEQNETDRQAFFDGLVEDIELLQSNYQELFDTGVLQTNINTKLEALEEEYAPKLTEVTAQLAQKANQTELIGTNLRVDNLVIPLSPENSNVEVTDARVSTTKGKTFTTLRNRFEESENDLIKLDSQVSFKATNSIDNGNFALDDDEDGLANEWLKGSQVTNERIENGVQYWTGVNTTYNSGLRQILDEPLIANHVYYMQLKTSNIHNILWFSTSILPVKGEGYNELVSTTFTPTTSDGTYMQIRPLGSNEASISNFVLIDLTSSFGAGNEPTANEMKEVLEKNHNGWFDKTVNLYTLKDVATLSEETKKNADKLAIDVDNLANKEQMGYVDLIGSELKYASVAARAGTSLSNALESIVQSAHCGMDGVEIDVRLTKDHEVVLIHDGVIDNILNGSGNVSDYTLAELKEFRFIQNSIESPYERPIRLGTLDEAMEVCRKYGLILFIDMKTDGYESINQNALADKCMEIATQAGMQNKCVFISTSVDTMLRIRNSLPKATISIKRYIENNTLASDLAIIDQVKGNLLMQPEYSSGVNWSVLTDERIKAYHERNLPIKDVDFMYITSPAPVLKTQRRYSILFNTDDNGETWNVENYVGGDIGATLTPIPEEATAGWIFKSHELHYWLMLYGSPQVEIDCDDPDLVFSKFFVKNRGLSIRVRIGNEKNIAQSLPNANTQLKISLTFNASLMQTMR